MSAVCTVEYIFKKKQASCHVIHWWAKFHARLAHLNRKLRRVDVTNVISASIFLPTLPTSIFFRLFICSFSHELFFFS